MADNSQLLSMDPPTTTPANDSRSAFLIARAELLGLWSDPFWTTGVMLVTAEAVRTHAISITGSRGYAVFDVEALHKATKSRPVAHLLLGLAGAYTTQISGKPVWTNRENQPHGAHVTFERNFIPEALRDRWEHASDHLLPSKVVTLRTRVT